MIHRVQDKVMSDGWRKWYANNKHPNPYDYLISFESAYAKNICVNFTLLLLGNEDEPMMKTMMTQSEKKKTTTYIHSFQRHVWKKTQEMKTKRSVFAIKLLTFWNGMWNISRMCECVLCIVCIYVSFCLCCFSHANFAYITQVVYLLLFFPYLRWWMAIVSVK